MKISELIEYVKELRPGTPYSDIVFLRWVNDLEAEFCTEVYLLSVEDFAEHTATDESVTVDSTHTKIFWSYLLAMISLANGEMARYNDDFAIFKGFMTEYKSWYAITYHPADKKAIVSGYYLTAYALAVKYGFEGTEEEWVNAVEYSRVEAESAAESAKSAQEAAEKAKTSAEEAKAEVVTNTKEAQAAASTATQKASDATVSAKAAADSAADSARKATESADSAQAAAESATDASESATNASTAKAAAEAAQQAAETAKAAAQEAQNLAESAKVAAETAATNAGTSETNAKAAQTAAENAKNLAETAQNAAEGAQSAAETAKNAAAQSAQNAQESADNAENSADESETWACGTIGGVAVHSTHPAYQNNAKWYKDQAREIVGGDYATKTEVQGYVGTHNSDSTAHEELFSEKLDKTGNGSNVTASFIQAETRENIGTGEKLSEIFGKIKKWFADFGSLAFKSMVAKADLDENIKISLGKADTAFSNVLGKANKRIPTATGNIATLDANGNLADSEKQPKDFETPAGAQAKADSVQNKLHIHLEDDVPHARKALKGYSEITISNTAAIGTINLNLVQGNVFNLTLAGDVTLVFLNPSTNASSVTVFITQSATAYAITFSTNVKWQDGKIPDISTASKTHILTFATVDSGTTWYGMFGGVF